MSLNTLTINGTALTGIYVDAARSFDKPAKRVDTFEIPGRNGNLIIDEGTFDNVLITYPVFEKNTFPTEFDSIVNWLASLKGYQRIECSNDPGHYRLGRFVVPETPTAKRLNKDGFYSLSFDCKPQRFLTSGETVEEITVASQSTQYGPTAIASFDAEEGAAINSLEIAITPIQSGSGDPSPTNIRPITGWTGANIYDDPKYGGTIEFNQKFPTKTLSYAGTNYTITSNNDGKFTVNVTATASESIGVNHTSINASTFTAGHVYAWIGNSDKIKVSLKAYAKRTDTIFKATTAAYSNIVFIFDNLTVGTYEVFPQLFDLTEMFGQEKAEEVLSAELSSTGSGVAWFRNLFYKTYYPVNAGETTCVSAVNGDEYRHYPISWQTEAGTVYGGSLNVATGVLTVTHGYIASYAGETLPSAWISDRDVYSAGATPTTGAQVVYELATPLTYQLTPTEVSTLLGENNVWADTGDVTVIVQSPSTLPNPTLYASKPLIRAYGTGSFTVGSVQVTITSNPTYIDIDCELMDCFTGATNMNQYVSFSGNDFPELEPGDNSITLSGITKLEITPRWWML